MGTIAHDATQSPKTPASETRLKAVPAEVEEREPTHGLVFVADALADLEEDLMIACDAANHGAAECDVCERLKGGLQRLSGRLTVIRDFLEDARKRRPRIDPALFALYTKLHDAGVELGTIPSLEAALELFAELSPPERRKVWSVAAIALAVKTDCSGAPIGTWARRLDLAEAALEERAQLDARPSPAGTRRRGRTAAAAAE